MNRATNCTRCQNTGELIRFHDSERVVMPCRHRKTFAPRNKAAAAIPATGMQTGDTEQPLVEDAGVIPIPIETEEQRFQAVSINGEGKVPTTASNDKARTPLAIRPAGIEAIPFAPRTRRQLLVSIADAAAPAVAGAD